MQKKSELMRNFDKMLTNFAQIREVELDKDFKELMQRQYMRAVADPGEAVGCLAAQGPLSSSLLHLLPLILFAKDANEIARRIERKLIHVRFIMFRYWFNLPFLLFYDHHGANMTDKSSSPQCSLKL